MKIEVFKEFGGGFRIFDSVNPDYITWLFDSINKRDQPPEFINDEAQGPQSADTIYFDASPSNVKLRSELSNVVLDYRAPEAVLQYLTGSFNAFRIGSTKRWHVEVVFKDDSGIDSGAYRVYVTGKEDNGLLISSRKESSGPEYSPVITDNTNGAISVQFEKSPVLNNMYKMSIDIDPSKLGSDMLRQCNELLSYLRLSVDIYDISGNLLQFEFPDPFILFELDQNKLVESLSKLRISFADTYPLNMLIGPDEIGKTTIVVENKNLSLASIGMIVKIGLASDSVGYLVPTGREDEQYDPSIEQDSLTSIQLVDGIDTTGNVHAFAYLTASSENISCELSGEEIKLTLDDDLSQRIKNATYSEGLLGRFITECEDNTRKIYIDPFVPEVLKNEEIFGLCKLFENYLNTAYSKLSGDCRIGVLEKTSRISDFKNIDRVEPELIGNFAREYGSELNITDDDIKSASEVLKKYSSLDFNNEDIVDRVYRRLYSILPYIDQYKGTLRAFDLVFNVLGIDANMYQLWQDPYNSSRMTREENAGPDWQLTSHIALELAEGYTKDDVRKLSEFTLKVAKSILPLTRVISDLIAVDKTESHYDEETGTNIKDTNIVIENADPEPILNNDETITFTWNSTSLLSGIASSSYTIDIPCYADSVQINGAGALPDCSAFFINRWFITKKTMDSCPIYLKFDSPSTTVMINADRIDIHRNRVRLTLPKTTDSYNAITTYNNMKANLTSSMSIKFKFNRSVGNYCISLN